MAKPSTVLWLDKEYICDAINLKSTFCKTFSVIGCNTGKCNTMKIRMLKADLKRDCPYLTFGSKQWSLQKF